MCVWYCKIYILMCGYVFVYVCTLNGKSIYKSLAHIIGLDDDDEEKADVYLNTIKMLVVHACSN